MPIFGIVKGRVDLIPEVSFDIEKDVQKLVEENMKTIFGINFVTSEFELNGLRVDSLGYDREANSFVIFEFKRDKNFSVIDQGYAYLALLLNNKAEFVLLYNEKSSPQIKKSDINWSQSKVAFVSPFFTIYQRKAIEFQDLPIELWEVKRYSNGTILFNQIQAPQRSESISTVTQKSEVVRRVSQEVKIYKSVEGLPNRPPITEASDETESKYEYDERLTPEENKEVEEWCSDSTNPLADVCDLF